MLYMMEPGDNGVIPCLAILELCRTWLWWGDAAPDYDDGGDATTYMHDYDEWWSKWWWRWMMHLMMIMEWSDSYGYSEMHGIEVFNKVLLIRVVMVIYLGLVLRRWRCTWWCTWWWWWEVMSKEASPRFKKKKKTKKKKKMRTRGNVSDSVSP